MSALIVDALLGVSILMLVDPKDITEGVRCGPPPSSLGHFPQMKTTFGGSYALGVFCLDVICLIYNDWRKKASPFWGGWRGRTPPALGIATLYKE